MRLCTDMHFSKTHLQAAVSGEMCSNVIGHYS